MTGPERASLERLEDKFDRWSARHDDKLDDIDRRLRNVEQVQATHLGALEERKESHASRLSTAGVLLSAAVIIIGLPAASVMVVTLVNLVGG